MTLHKVLPGVTMTERPLAAGIISEFRMFTQEALQVMFTTSTVVNSYMIVKNGLKCFIRNVPPPISHISLVTHWGALLFHSIQEPVY